MATSVGLVALIVRDYEEGIAFYTDRLGFRLVEDSVVASGAAETKRWVVVEPQPAHGQAGASLLLAKAANAEQLAAVGHQAGGRVFLFLFTDDFARDHAAFRERGVTFCEEPRAEPYGSVAVFVDLYGNRWDLIERGAERRTS